MRFSFGTDISAIPVLFTYSEGATSSVGEGGTFDFTDPLAITVTAQDGVTSQEWTIFGTLTPNTAAHIESVIIDIDTEEILIDADSHTVNIRFNFGTDLTAIPVIFTYSEGATSSVGEGGTFDFTSPIAITITAQDGVTFPEWTISGKIALNTATDILSVVVDAQTDEIVIDNEAHTVDMVFASNTDLSSVFLEFTLSEGGTSSPVSGSSFDLTSSATISVTAEDGITTQDWTITAEADNVLGVINDAMVFQFYPNPVQDVLNVQTQNRSRVYLSNIQGIQMTPEVVGLQFQFNLSELQPGVYQLIVIEGGNISISKIIKTN